LVKKVKNDCLNHKLPNLKICSGCLQIAIIMRFAKICSRKLLNLKKSAADVEKEFDVPGG